MPMVPYTTVTMQVAVLQTTRALMDKLDKVFVKGESDSLTLSSGTVTMAKRKCPAAEEDSSGASTAADPQITMDQVLGLWYIQGITLAIAIAHTVLVVLAYNRKVRQGLIVITRSLTGGRSLRAVAPEPGTQTDNNGMLVMRTNKPPQHMSAATDDCMAELTLVQTIATTAQATGCITYQAGMPKASHNSKPKGSTNQGQQTVPQQQEELDRQLRLAADLLPSPGGGMHQAQWGSGSGAASNTTSGSGAARNARSGVGSSILSSNGGVTTRAVVVVADIDDEEAAV